MKLSDREKLILLILCEIQDHLEMKGMKAETDTQLVKEATYSGKLMGIKVGLHGVFHDHETPESIVSAAVD
jgi:hypothetical protein